MRFQRCGSVARAVVAVLRTPSRNRCVHMTGDNPDARVHFAGCRADERMLKGCLNCDNGFAYDTPGSSYEHRMICT